MSLIAPTNCSDCAYARKENEKMYCPFHDLPVRPNLVCDDFLHEMDSPQWKSLTDGITGQEKKVPQYTGMDIFTYVMTIVLLVFPSLLWLLSLL